MIPITIQLQFYSINKQRRCRFIIKHCNGLAVEKVEAIQTIALDMLLGEICLYVVVVVVGNMYNMGNPHSHKIFLLYILDPHMVDHMDMAAEQDSILLYDRHR